MPGPARFRTVREFDLWLRKNHALSRELDVEFAKKDSGEQTITYDEAVEIALCWGWIDAKKMRSANEGFWLQRFTPRRKSSVWSKANVAKATALIESGRMKQPGLNIIEEAKANGNWDRAYDPASTAEPHPDLLAALERNPRAAAFFATLKGANRYAIIFRVHTARREQTRAQRIAKFIGMLERGDTIYPR